MPWMNRMIKQATSAAAIITMQTPVLANDLPINIANERARVE